MNEKKQVSIKETLELLDEGKNRQEIAEHWGITVAECGKLFKHPKLVGKKAKKILSFVILDDTDNLDETVPSPEEETTETTEEN